MTKVLIVDDEPIVRIGIRAMGDWENAGFSMAYEASNGRCAIEKIKENPDINILITDIDMPVMDGIELIKRVKEFSPNMPILVLSAYSDYTLVRQAFKHGIFDYIKKSDMSFESILEQLKNAQLELAKHNHNEKYMNELKEYEESLKKYELREAVLGGNCSYTLEEGTHCLVSLLVDDGGVAADGSEREPAYNSAGFSDNVLNVINNNISSAMLTETVSILPNEYIILLTFLKKQSEADFYRNITAELKKLQLSLKNYLNTSFSAGIGMPFAEESGLPTGYEQAKKAAELYFFFGRQEIFSYEKTYLTHNAALQIFPETQNLYALLSAGDLKGAAELAAEALITPNNLPTLSSGEVCLFYRGVLQAFAERSRDKIKIEQSLGKVDEMYGFMQRFDTLEELNKWAVSKLDEIVAYLKQEVENQLSDFVIKSVEYVRKNYKDPEITVEKMSEIVCVSPSYFSATFARQTGERFHDYLISVRIHKAKELIDQTTLKDYEIAQQIGITNSETFSRLFKRIVGVSPREYRKGIR